MSAVTRWLTRESITERAQMLAARSTRRVVLSAARELGMWVGCGYPKSGTVWLCQLMGAYLDLPYPRHYRAPIAMPAVVHAHWNYDERLTQAVYISRDGRDVLTSLYFYAVRRLQMPNKPQGAMRAQELFDHLYGSSFDPADVRGNLARFVESELTTPRLSRQLPWQRHAEDWLGRPGVRYTTYEALLEDAPRALVSILGDVVHGDPFARAQHAAGLFEFRGASGRTPGQEDRSSFLRKGVAGDWLNHFDADTARVFDDLAGETLVALGYEPDRSWVQRVST